MQNLNLTTEYVSQVRILIGSWVKEFRKSKSITQLQLATELGITEATVSKIEAGKWMSLEMLIKIGIKLNFYLFLFEKDNTNDDLLGAMRNKWRQTYLDK